MKTIANYLTVLCVLCAAVSCHEKQNKETEAGYIASIISTLKIGDSTKWVVILPGLGCHGCIQEGEQFMKDNVENKTIFFVLTKIESLKILQNKIGTTLKSKSNIYTDRDNSIDIPGNNNIYPCIIQVDQGKVKEYEFQSPRNGLAFFNLQSRLQAEKL